MTDKVIGLDPPKNPYVGLIPYNEDDAAFFFGRDLDIHIITSNLRASQLTILYGASGVGKSSLIRAGVIPRLKGICGIEPLPETGVFVGDDANHARIHVPDFIPVMLRDWSSDPLDSLCRAIKEAATEQAERVISGSDKAQTAEVRAKLESATNETADERDISKVIRRWSEVAGTKFLIVLDQFESLFNNPKYFAGAGSFGDRLPAAINSFDVPAHFLISLRDDAVSKLDVFKGRLNLDNLLRLKHLNREQACEAIVKPILKYNELKNEQFGFEGFEGTQPADFDSMLFDAGVVQEIIDKVAVSGQADAGQTQTSETSDGRPRSTANYECATTYLQLVMQRLWEHDTTKTTHKISTATLNTSLGGVENIIRSHVDEKFGKLSDDEQKLLSKFIQFTVTSDGRKLPCDPTTLESWSGVKGSKDDIKSILEKLCEQDSHVFRKLDTPGGSESGSAAKYEFTHDALAKAVLGWRARYYEKLHDSVSYQIGKFIKVFAPGIGLIAVVLAALGIWFLLKASNEFQVLTNQLGNANTDNASIKKTSGLIKDEILVSDQLLAAILSFETGEGTEPLAALKTIAELGNNLTIDEKTRQSVFKLLDNQRRIFSKDEQEELKIAKERFGKNVAKPNVTIFANDPNQPDLDFVAEKLKDSFQVERKSAGADGSQSAVVRYFNKNDSNLAGRMLIYFASYGIMLRGDFIDKPASGNDRRDVEVWLTGDSLQRAALTTTDLNLRTETSEFSKSLVTLDPNTKLSIVYCDPKFLVIDGKRGRWCKTTYKAQTGYVFDAYLDFQD